MSVEGLPPMNSLSKLLDYTAWYVSINKKMEREKKEEKKTLMNQHNTTHTHIYTHTQIRWMDGWIFFSLSYKKKGGGCGGGGECQ